MRADIEEHTGGDLLDEDAVEPVDGVLLWWREDDGDPVDVLRDAKTRLASDGVIWVLTPSTGREGHIEPGEISKAGPQVDLSQTSDVTAGQDWSATRLVPPTDERPSSPERLAGDRARGPGPGGSASSATD